MHRSNLTSLPAELNDYPGDLTLDESGNRTLEIRLRTSMNVQAYIRMGGIYISCKSDSAIQDKPPKGGSTPIDRRLRHAALHTDREIDPQYDQAHLHSNLGLIPARRTVSDWSVLLCPQAGYQST